MVAPRHRRLACPSGDSQSGLCQKRHMAALGRACGEDGDSRTRKLGVPGLVATRDAAIACSLHRAASSTATRTSPPWEANVGRPASSNGQRVRRKSGTAARTRLRSMEVHVAGVHRQSAATKNSAGGHGVTGKADHARNARIVGSNRTPCVHCDVVLTCA